MEKKYTKIIEKKGKRETTKKEDENENKHKKNSIANTQSTSHIKQYKMHNAHHI